jgi:hypothetical protein
MESKQLTILNTNGMKAIEPAQLRKYLYEYALLALAGCVVYLFFQLNSLQLYIRNDLSQQRNEVVKVIYQNNVMMEALLHDKTR